MGQFVHLHVHTEYSLREGALRIADCVRTAADLGMPAVAITDTNAMYGVVSFYKAAKAVHIKPIIGVQLSVGRDADHDLLREGRPGGPLIDRAVLLAENWTGYQHLVQLVTLAHTRERQPFVTFGELGERANGIIALVGGGESAALKCFSSGETEEAEAWLRAWQQVVPATHLYVDVQDHNVPDERRGLPSLIRWARGASVPLAATNDVHYLRREDADIQRVLAQLESNHSGRLLPGDRYEFASAEEMERRFAKLQEAVDNTVVIAQRCNVELPIGQTLLPKYPTPSGEDAAVVLRRAAEAGVRRRYGTPSPQVLERLNYELDIIERLGFADYFLVVADFIRFAHKNGISTGPGRGSAASSIVAYALKITDVDPIANRLLFERFLNPERVTWPDIDTDFEYERRIEAIHYVVERYGRDRVAQIGTFGTLAARAAIRDAGRVLQVAPKLVDQMAKLIPGHPGVTLQQAREEVGAIRDLLAANEHAQSLWETAVALEGFPRHTSVHAAGVVISPIPLDNLVPVQPGADGTPVTQFPMADVEAVGLMKMDFLGLRTLTLLDRCVASIQRRTGQPFNWKAVPMDDPATFAMLARGETDGCFQLESPGMRRVLRDLKPSGFEDMVAVVALYRPGPMENIPTFIAARHGRTPVHYPHPDLEPILQDTYGVIVYQEQIMQIASLMAGFSLGQADLLRRAVSKKKRDVLEAERTRFVDGCMARGYEEAVANEVYDLIVRFADYGFPRSHAAAYAVLAYRTAYLRANHLTDFLAALLSMAIGANDKITLYTRDARQHGIQVLPPCVAQSGAYYEAESDTVIRTGLLSVRNVGRGAVEAILQAKRERPFASLVDFLERVNNRACNRKAVESLLEAGAFARFLPDGASGEVALQLLNQAYAAVEERAKGVQGGLNLTFGDEPDAALYIRCASVTRPLVAHIQSLLRTYPGEVRVALYDEAKRRVRLLEPKWTVTVTPELIGALEELVGIGNARIGRIPSGSAGGRR
ncbi:DNA polymerase III subunit alpha [Alicyclobacillus cycloheptanicus]|uniref:DNA-directed DNA polymerase n=1 Tax=Alicyclobacillus cycloheptanicus TaxID=1457 RepID=A0ABT9XLP7_9BACL|nr:DNA polymerase III subunit alpha [Alicyclobacillus cycloheptanicus]MDQ0191147.1 DNA polymerase-3 subunit alpha [Alicyclobacillus cycloheptanicus]WDM01888.1 DNA polymerase III subunit alpha [Alicyclobacillus cycloheptanicus]